jgi:hypothetical protein
MARKSFEHSNRGVSVFTAAGNASLFSRLVSHCCPASLHREWISPER